MSLRSRRRRKAWGGAKRNPRIVNTKKLTEHAERQTEVAITKSSFVNDSTIGRSAGFGHFPPRFLNVTHADAGVSLAQLVEAGR